MNESINWQKLTTEQKDRLIDEKVIKRNDPDEEHTIAWQGRDMLLEIAKRLIEKNDTASLPVPSYTTSMDAAWLLIEHLEIGATLTYTPAFIPQEPDGRLPHYKCEIVQVDLIGGNDKIARAIANTPAEAICIAALRWCGIQATHTIETIPCWQVTFEDGETLIYKNKHEAEQALRQREQQLKANLQWAVNVRKLKIEEVLVPEDYFNGPVIG
jgi:hypothetical protein